MRHALPLCLLAALFGSPTAMASDDADGGAGAQSPPAPVLYKGKPVFEVRAGNGTATPAERAQAAEIILEQVLDEPGERPPVAVEPLAHGPDEPEAFALRIGGRELLRLGPADIAQSGLSREVYLEELRATTEGFVSREHRRDRLRAILQAISLTVFLGLLVVLALRWVGEAAARVRATAEERLHASQGLRLRNMELLSAEAVQGFVFVALAVGRVALQIGLVYAYLAFALSQFDATRGWVGPLTGTVTSPFVALLARLGSLLPAAVLLVAFGYLLRGALRLSGFLLGQVGRGDFHWAWLPQDLAPAARPLARTAIVVLALLAYGPLAGAGTSSLLTRLGLLLVAALALAATPALGAAVLGTLAIFGRAYRVGEWVAIGPHVGEVTEVGLFEVTLVPVDAGRVRIPHLVALWTPVRHFASAPGSEIEIPVPVGTDQDAVLAALRSALGPDERVAISLARIDPTAAHYRVRLPASHSREESLAKAVRGLAAADLGFGSAPRS